MRHSELEFSLISKDRRVRPSGRLWNPSADVYRAPDGWIVKLDLAGICSDDLDIELRDNMLTIHGCRGHALPGRFCLSSDGDHLQPI